MTRFDPLKLRRGCVQNRRGPIGRSIINDDPASWLGPLRNYRVDQPWQELLFIPSGSDYQVSIHARYLPCKVLKLINATPFIDLWYKGSCAFHFANLRS